MTAGESPTPPLLAGDTRVINIGLELFAQSLAGLGVRVVHVDWRPPAGGDARLANLLARLSDTAGDPGDA